MTDQDRFDLSPITEDLDVQPRLSAAQVRRRGGARRARRQVGAGVAAVAVLAVGAVAVNNLGSSSGPDWATTPTPVPSEPEPTASPTNTAHQPTWDNVPGPDDLPATDIMTWGIAEERETWSAAGPWEAGSLQRCVGTEVGADTVLIRGFDGEPGEWDITAVTLGFPDAAAASVAHEAIANAYADCTAKVDPSLTEVALWQPPGEIPLPPGLEGEPDRNPVVATGAAVALIPETGEPIVSSTAIVQAGPLLTWLVSEHPGYDLNCGLVSDDLLEQCDVYSAAAATAQKLID